MRNKILTKKNLNMKQKLLFLMSVILMAMSMSAETYGPLLTAEWSNEAPFKNQCKFVYNGTTYTCEAGPAAIAASMVLHYWRYPKSVDALDGYSGKLTISSSSVSSVDYDYPELPATTFDWGNMKDNYTSYNTTQANAVATLVRYAGHALSTNYGIDIYGSETYPSNIVNMFVQFGYDATTCRLVAKSDYSESEWATLIQGEIKAGRPVVYRASNSRGDGHAFVVDGYDPSNDTYHVNFGWGGDGNDWLEMNSFGYGSDTYLLFNQDQKAVVGIQQPQRYAPVMQPANVSYIGLNSFRADWTDETSDDMVDSYTLEVSPAPLHSLSGSWYPGSYEDISLPAPWSGARVRGGKNVIYFRNNYNGDGQSGYITYTIPDGYTNATFTLKITTGSGTDGKGNLTVETTQTAAVTHTFAAGETYSWVVTASSGEKITITTTDDNYSPDIALIEVYAGDGTEGQVITGITDKFCTVENLETGGTYQYRVKALYTNGAESEWSNVEEVTITQKPVPYALLTATWDNDAPFYNDCKFKYNGEDYQCKAGPTAIAASMVLYYWQYPETIGALDEYSGQLSYSIFSTANGYSYPALPATTFKWDKIKDEYAKEETGEAADAVAELVHYAGHAQQIYYGVWGSGLDMEKADNIVTMFVQFGYDSKTCRLAAKSDYSESEWATLIQDEIKAGRPVVYMASSTIGGHAFVVDGYDPSNDTYHVNFGWGGDDNGWLEMNSFKVEDEEETNTYTYTFNQNQMAVVGIQPLTDAEPYAVLTDSETDEGKKTLTFYYDANKAAWLDEVGDANVFDIPWDVDPESDEDDYPGWTNSYPGNDEITTVEFDASFGDYHGLESTKNMFYRLNYLTAINGLEYLNTENVTNMRNMFGCPRLASLDLGDNFDTSKVTDMNDMFYIFGYYCTAPSLKLGSNFNTSNVTDMSWMFRGCGVKSLDVSGFDTKNVKTMEYMFIGCRYLKSIDVSKFNTSNVTNMHGMFGDCNNLEELDVSGFDTKNVKTMGSMFSGCNKLESIDVSNFNTEEVTNMSGMFWNCQALETIYCAEATDWSGVNGRTYTDMFAGCSKLSGKCGSKSFECDGTNDIDGTYAKVFDGTNGGYFTSITERQAYAVLTDNETDEYQTLTFYYDASKAAWQNAVGVANVFDVPWDVDPESNVDDDPDWWWCYEITTVTFDKSFKDYDGLKSTKNMFYYLGALTTINNLEYLNTENVTDMYQMFSWCTALKSLNLSNFNTSNVTNMSEMFYYCEALETLELGDNFDTSKVINMSGMFRFCQALKTLDLSNFNTSQVNDMSEMFYYCPSLETLELGGNFDTKNVTNMSWMFAACDKLKTLDVSNFDTKNVTDMSVMFAGCKALTSLDVSNFDTKKVTDMSDMFNYCPSLETIYCAEGTDWSTSSADKSNMFDDCDKLSGKCGSEEFKYIDNYGDGDYAKMYNGTDGGYFTYAPNRSYTLTVTGAKMATLYLDFPALIPENVDVYYCEKADFANDETPYSIAHKVQRAIPANTGVFVIADEGEYVFPYFVPDEGEVLQIYPDNILTGSTQETTVEPHSVLTLGYGNKTEKLGFWCYTGTTIPAHRAYIPGSALESTTGDVKGITIVFDEETGISLTPNPSPQGEGSWYSIDGRKLEGSRPRRDSISIMGRKY